VARDLLAVDVHPTVTRWLLELVDVQS